MLDPSALGPYAVRLERNVRIPMADGITLAADRYVPEGRPGQRFPALIEYTPYHKNNNRVYGPRATRYPYFASHGYVFVNVDIRGLGDSEGHNTSPSSPEEAADGQEVIRWCAAQPWCDGAVGMIGISYTAGVCWDAARRAPEALKAIVVCQMCSDWLEGVVCPGGSPRPFIWENYAPLMAAYNFAPPDPELVGERWAETWQQRLDHSVPWSLAYLEHLRDGPFWEERLLRGDARKVRAATFLIGGWCDYYPDDLLRVYSALQCPKRVLIGPWTHNYPENAWPLPRVGDRLECLRWFDRHLKGRDTDPQRPVDREPPVTLFVTEFTAPASLRPEDAGSFRGETSWPPAAREVLFFLAPEGRLEPGHPDDPGRDELWITRRRSGRTGGERCGEELAWQATCPAGSPLRHQTPKIAAPRVLATECCRNACSYRRRGGVSRARLPVGLSSAALGPKLGAMITLLTGRYPTPPGVAARRCWRTCGASDCAGPLSAAVCGTESKIRQRWSRTGCTRR